MDQVIETVMLWITTQVKIDYASGPKMFAVTTPHRKKVIKQITRRSLRNHI